MLIKEKKIVRATIVLDEVEKDHLYWTRVVADCFLAELKDHKAKEMISLETGEVIERQDIERLIGILSAMGENSNWEIVK